MVFLSCPKRYTVISKITPTEDKENPERNIVMNYCSLSSISEYLTGQLDVECT
jgi:hypothetical protein